MEKMMKIRMIWFVFFHGMMLVLGTIAERPGITIDCGNEAANNTPQADTPDTGNSIQLPSQFQIDEGLDSLYKTLRSFPDGKRNCYTLKPIGGKNNRYLIRARFMYGNYDNTNNFPAFDVYVGGNLWSNLNIATEHPTSKEMIYKPETDFVHVCLVNIDQGTPFISALELRPLDIEIYNSSAALATIRRYDTSQKTTLTSRFYNSSEVDEYDRLWSPLLNKHFQKGWKVETTTAQLRDLEDDVYKIPIYIFQTRALPKANDTLSIEFVSLFDSSVYYIYWHFGETEPQGREFSIYLTNNNFTLGTFKLPFMQEFTIVSNPITLQEGETTIHFYITKTNASKLPPILNAVELYRDLNFLQPATYQDDADAMMNIKNSYKSSIIKGWQGDPCLPIVPWDGLNCSNITSDDPPRITSMNLSSKGLKGEILLSISNLTSLNYLDLSNNSLTGTIPEFLAEMQSLTFIDLQGNKLNGSVPVRLLEKKENGSLTLRLDNNPELLSICTSKKCLKKSKKQKWFPLITCAVILSILVVVGGLVAYKWKGKRKTALGSRLKSKNQCFRHSEIVTMTHNFSTELGEGGFGTVYLGSLKDGTNVAVKMLRKPSGLKSFQTEAELLMRVHHKNLVSLIGYCDEGKTTSLVYEYMAKGDVHKHLSAEAGKNCSSWVERLQISCDAAQGLEYLHTGCKPTIIHRDIKTANILLDENLRAKVADLGMSRIFANESAIDQITADYVVGTFGYLDPEYHNTGKLNEKSDVYSFGVVLMELITGRTAIIKSSNDSHVSIITWVKSLIDRAEIHDILDQSFGENFNENSAWKAIEIAVACVSPIGIERPTMTEVLYELKECLILEEKAKKGVLDQDAYQPTSSRGVFDIVHVDSEASIGCSAG